MTKIDLLYADVGNLDDERLDELYKGMPVKFKDELDLKTDRRSFRLSLCGRVLLRQLLQTTGAGCSLEQIEIMSGGKPYFQSGPAFSIAHSGNIVACAISRDVAIGLDIEMLRPIKLADYSDYLSEMEWELVTNANEPEAAVIGLWVRKEALLKAAGAGLGDGMQSIDVTGGHAVVAEMVYGLKDIGLAQGYHAAIATDVLAFDVDLDEYRFAP